MNFIFCMKNKLNPVLYVRATETLTCAIDGHFQITWIV